MSLYDQVSTSEFKREVRSLKAKSDSLERKVQDIKQDIKNQSSTNLSDFYYLMFLIIVVSLQLSTLIVRIKI